MPRTIPFAEAEYQNGKRKGETRKLTFSTSIDAENANGLPIKKNANGKNVVQMSINAGLPETLEFDSAGEVRDILGSDLDRFLLESANIAAKAATRSALTKAFYAAKAAPANVGQFVADICSGVAADPAAIFAPVAASTATKKTSVKALNKELVSDASELMKTAEGQAQLLAMIAAIGNKLK